MRLLGVHLDDRAPVGRRRRGQITATAVEQEPGRPVVRIPLEADAGDGVTVLTGWEPPAPEGILRL